jgi:hypothetical protein
MTNLTKLEFVALDISGKNYLSWTLNAEIHLTVNNLGDTIKMKIRPPRRRKPKQ